MPRWYRDVTAALLPERLRTSFELPFDGREQRRAARALGAVRRLHPALPARLRYVAPYHEALTRLSGRNRPDLATRTLNRLWIGRPSMGLIQQVAFPEQVAPSLRAECAAPTRLLLA